MELLEVAIGRQLGRLASSLHLKQLHRPQLILTVALARIASLVQITILKSRRVTAFLEHFVFLVDAVIGFVGQVASCPFHCRANFKQA